MGSPYFADFRKPGAEVSVAVLHCGLFWHFQNTPLSSRSLCCLYYLSIRGQNPDYFIKLLILLEYAAFPLQ